MKKHWYLLGIILGIFGNLFFMFMALFGKTKDLETGAILYVIGARVAYALYIVYDIVWIALFCEKCLPEAENKNRRIASIIIILGLQVLTRVVSTIFSMFVV